MRSTQNRKITCISILMILAMIMTFFPHMPVAAAAPEPVPGNRVAGQETWHAASEGVKRVILTVEKLTVDGQYIVEPVALTVPESCSAAEALGMTLDGPRHPLQQVGKRCSDGVLREQHCGWDGRRRLSV